MDVRSEWRTLGTFSKELAKLQTSGQYHPRPCLKDHAEHGLP